MFRPGIRAGVFIWEEFKKFPARLPRSRSQKPRSRLPGQPAFSYEHIEIFVKKRAARRDLGNRASPVNRAHMKRPLFDIQHVRVYIKKYSDPGLIQRKSQTFSFAIGTQQFYHDRISESCFKVTIPWRCQSSICSYARKLSSCEKKA